MVTPSLHKKKAKSVLQKRRIKRHFKSPSFLSSVLSLMESIFSQLGIIKKSAKDTLFLRGEGHGSRDAENAGRIRVGSNSLEVDRDTSGNAAGDRDALGQGGGGDGDGAGVRASGQGGAEITAVGVNVDSPWRKLKEKRHAFSTCRKNDKGRRVLK